MPDVAPLGRAPRSQHLPPAPHAEVAAGHPPGQPLEPALAHWFGTAFGRDFSAVRGMYYTSSSAWKKDDMESAGWGWFVLEAYRDVKSTGLL